MEPAPLEKPLEPEVVGAPEVVVAAVVDEDLPELVGVAEPEPEDKADGVAVKDVDTALAVEALILK
jgi:hypothetical protein